jgi:hypothetical protein
MKRAQLAQRQCAMAERQRRLLQRKLATAERDRRLVTVQVSLGEAVALEGACVCAEVWPL